MKKIIGSFMICAVLCFLGSCEDFMDVHKDFTKGGEIIYAPKVDSIAFIAGKERILFRFWLYNSPNVKTVDLYWNSRADSLVIPVTPSSGLDSVEVMIDNLTEKSYTFDVRTTDNFGHKSLWMTDFGNVYGALYEATLLERRVRSVALSEAEGTVTMFTGIEDMVRTEVRYQTISGETKTLSVARAENEVLCPHVKPGSTFEYRSLFIPEEEAIDTFALAWTEGPAFPDIFRYDRSDWEVLAVSSTKDSDGGGMHTLIDGNLGSYWHSYYGSDGNAPLPHWAVIDMKSSKDIVRIETYRRPGNKDTKDIEYYVGPDPDPDATTWVKIGEAQYPNTEQDLITIDIDRSVDTKAGRYLKLVLPTSHRDPFITAAEIYLYGGSN